MSEKINEKELVEKIKKNKNLFSKVYELYYRRILAYIRKRVSGTATAEDIASTVFEKAFRNIDDFKWQGISLSSWLFRIARNLVIDHYRKNSKRKGVVSLDAVEMYVEDPAASKLIDFVQDSELKVSKIQ